MMMSLLPVKPNMQVRAEQIRMLYDQAPTVQTLGLLTGMIAVIVLWNLVDHSSLLIWFAMHALLSFIRLYLNVRFMRLQPTGVSALQGWGTLYVINAFISGMIWASLCLFFDPSWPAPYQVILFVIFTGITAGSFNTHTPYFIAFPAFYLPPTISLTLMLFQQHPEGYLELSTLCAIYIVLMYSSALRYNRSLTRSLEIRFENEMLADELSASNQRLSSLAETDPLTNLFNRRSMFHRLSAEWNRHYRSQTELSLMYIDLDCFKQYNDTYGHEAGDQCLIRISKLLHNHALRSSDMAARFGGEEFALILPETGKHDAERIADSIINDLTHLHIPHTGSTVTDHVTVSIGIASMTPDQPDNDAELRESADRMLYEAKHTGRNRFVSAPGARSEPEPVAVA